MFEKPIGTKKDTLAGERYEVKDDYKRFNQKNNFIYQGEWNPLYPGLSRYDLRQAREDKLKRGIPGFTRLDWAYQMASTANTNATNLVINEPNKGGNSWNGIPKSAIGSENITDLPEYKGDPASTARIIKRMARRYGASDVGICALDRRWVYSEYYDPETKESFPVHFSDEPGFEKYTRPSVDENRHQIIPAGMKYAIVFIHEMEYKGMSTAPTLTQMATTLQTYSEISLTAISMAEFIRGLGYNAIPSANCTAINIPLAVDAGLGELGRNAKLIHPRFGPRCRISKVITDLPLGIDSPISFGVTKFCDSCKTCAKECPSKAIPEGERSFVPAGEYSSYGVLQWQCDHERCKRFQSKVGTNCGICIKACPYNKPDSFAHWFVTSVISLTSLANPLILKGDEIFEFGKLKKPEDFWTIDD